MKNKNEASRDVVVGPELSTLNYSMTEKLVEASILADQPITIEGSPGIGKTAMIKSIGKRLNMEVVTLILSQCEPTDVGGYPVVKTGTDDTILDRVPLGAVKAACDRPVILFLDELSTSPPAVQAASLRLIHERVAGERTLHPGTRVVAAQNPPTEAAAGWDQALPLIGRLTKVSMTPTHEEVSQYFFNMVKEQSHARVLARDFASVLGSRPALAELKPPAGAATTGKPWASPRAWERAIYLAGQVLTQENVPLDHTGALPGDAHRLFYAALAGNIGESATVAFVALRKLRDSLPTVREIVDNPHKAKAPGADETDLSVAALGLCMAVAEQDSSAALVYVSRLSPEISMAAMRMISSIPRQPTSKWYKDGSEAVGKILMHISKSYQRENERNSK